MGPAGSLRYPEDVAGQVLVLVLRISTLVGFQLLALLLEGVGYILQEDQPQYDMLLLRRVHVVAELVRRQPQLGFKAEIG